MSNRKSLPLYGVGPVYVAICILLTAAAVVSGHMDLFALGILEEIRIPFLLLGILFIVFGVFLWVKAVVTDKIEGMKIYNEEQVRKFMEAAGFVNIKAYHTPKHWMCLIGDKLE